VRFLTPVAVVVGMAAAVAGPASGCGTGTDTNGDDRVQVAEAGPQVLGGRQLLPLGLAAGRGRVQPEGDPGRLAGRVGRVLVPAGGQLHDRHEPQYPQPLRRPARRPPGCRP
jgi:hypothetical protein